MQRGGAQGRCRRRVVCRASRLPPPSSLHAHPLRVKSAAFCAQNIEHGRLFFHSKSSQGSLIGRRRHSTPHLVPRAQVDVARASAAQEGARRGSAACQEHLAATIDECGT